MKNILLINPYIYDFAAFDFWIKPTGLLLIGNLLKQLGFKTYLIDCLDRSYQYKKSAKYNSYLKKFGTGKFEKIKVPRPKCYNFDFNRTYSRYGIPENTFLEKLNNIPKPDVIFITSLMSYWYPGIKKCIEIINTKFNDIPILIGGIYANLWTKHAKKTFSDCNIITGQAEMKITKILNELFDLNLQPLSYNSCFIDNSPDYELYDTINTASVLTSRGCVYNCSYCASKKLFDKYLLLNQKKTYNLIKYLYKRNVKDISFSDDALLYDSENNIIPLLEKIDKNKLDINFHLINAVHAKFLNSKIAQLFKICNVKTIRIGFESSNSKWQKNTGNKMNLNNFELAVKNLFDANIEKKYIGAYILIGCPGQSPDDIKKSIDTIHSYGINAVPALYSPIPHTKFWNELEIHKIKNEPLFTNQTIYSALFSDMNPEIIQDLKLYARNGNLKL